MTFWTWVDSTLLIQPLLQSLNLAPGVHVEPEQASQRQQQGHTESDSNPESRLHGGIGRSPC